MIGTAAALAQPQVPLAFSKITQISQQLLRAGRFWAFLALGPVEKKAAARTEAFRKFQSLGRGEHHSRGFIGASPMMRLIRTREIGLIWDGDKICGPGWPKLAGTDGSAHK